ncbi:uncharacterized protein EAF01_010547 [Botrytis porri]|nr:uncharacterized protein EAF01_010547 [Botrytis porri]KAF7890738.1 hypothetical protein EAF01_010547 [Botrytis porri]
MFCETCIDFFRTLGEASTESEFKSEDTFPITGLFEHHTTDDAFKRALDTGCILCKKLRENLSYEALDLDGDKLAAFRLVCSWYQTGPKSGFDVVCSVDGFTKTSHISLMPVNPPEDRLLLPDYHETTNTGTDACFALANHWLKTCLSSHQGCKHLRPSSLKAWTPSRLIRIRGVDDLVLCLRQMGSIPIGVEYATLSHCWGKIPATQRLVLTSKNVSSWTRGMPDLKIMKTFDHAIIICRKLGLEYIWIDSLCILEDSRDDWYQEASLMSTVYKYSKFTITATAAIDDTVGCFFDRDLNICLPTRVEFLKNQICFLGASKQSMTKSNIFLDDSRSTLLRGRYDIQEWSTWTQRISNAPVSKRSWVLQERLLSPRVLHFSDRQLFWECAKLQASESLPFGMPEDANAHFKTLSPCRYQGQYFTDLDFEGETLLQKHRHLEYASLTWKSAIITYTKGKLTKSSDKLAAISAIARELQPLMRCRYLAGLWESALVFRLARYSYTDSYPSMMYRAPSWSWASIDGSIMFHPWSTLESFDPLIEILKVVTDLVGGDEFGQVKGGHLKLLGQAIDFEIILDMAEHREIIHINGQPTILCLTKDDKNMGIGVSTKKFCCLPLYLNLSFPQGFSSLILERVDIDNEVYRRVGTLSTSYFLPEKIVTAFREDPILSIIGDIEKSKDGSLAFKRGSADLREVVIV